MLGSPKYRLTFSPALTCWFGVLAVVLLILIKPVDEQTGLICVGIRIAIANDAINRVVNFLFSKR
jgi:hypothetical protein